jgi:hypothetical protein
MKVKLFAVVMMLICVCAVNADQYNWTGGTDTDFFNELNWDLDGSPGTNPPAGTIDPEVDINHDLWITSGTAEINAASFSSEPYLGPGVGTLTMTGGVLDMIGSLGANGLSASVDGTGDLANCAVLFGGSSLAQLQFVLDLDVSLADSATLELYGGGNPINRTGIDFVSPNASIYFTAETVAAAVSEHLGKLTVYGWPAMIGTDPSVLEPGDNLLIVSDGGAGSIVTTPIPEPATMMLLGLGGLLGLRRRK